MSIMVLLLGASIRQALHRVRTCGIISVVNDESFVTRRSGLVSVYDNQCRMQMGQVLMTEGCGAGSCSKMSRIGSGPFSDTAGQRYSPYSWTEAIAQVQGVLCCMRICCSGSSIESWARVNTGGIARGGLHVSLWASSNKPSGLQREGEVIRCTRRLRRSHRYIQERQQVDC